MQRVRPARRHILPTPLWRLLTVLVSLGQLLVVSAGWLDRPADATGARSHVEGGGTRLHHGHSASDCELCSARQVGGAPPASRPLPFGPPAAVAPSDLKGPSLVPGDGLVANGSRAPPVQL